MVHQCLAIALHVTLSLLKRQTSNVTQPFLIVLGFEENIVQAFSDMGRHSPFMANYVEKMMPVHVYLVYILFCILTFNHIYVSDYIFISPCVYSHVCLLYV